jgi:hypothetical protein
MRRIISSMALGGALLLAAVPAASAHDGATCSGVFGTDLVVHGQHVVGDYVTGLGGLSGGLAWPPAGQVGAAVKANGGAAVPGGPGPGFHFTIDGLAPGASFCNEQAHPNGFNTPDTGYPL